MAEIVDEHRPGREFRIIGLRDHAGAARGERIEGFGLRWRLAFSCREPEIEATEGYAHSPGVQGSKGISAICVAVTSQEKLGELVSGLDDKKIELARLMDRFPQQVHLEPSDISEVTSRRVLTKNAAAQAALGALFDQHRGRLAEHTRLTADIKLPELTRDGFVDLYPLLPYQIDLIIRVVSGLRTQGGSARHVGGANRTIIKLAQQLLINPAVHLAEEPLGTLARLDQVYDLVEGNIGSEVRAKIAAIPRVLDAQLAPLAQPVAKVICLLQYVQSVHRTAENIAAALHPGVAADSQLPSVREALRALEAAHQVRRGDDGYRIPTPAEDDWERLRHAHQPKPGDEHRLQAEVLQGFWQPQPSHTLYDAKTFKAGLALHGREIVEGDLNFQIYVADEGREVQELATELRTRSQQEREDVFWAIPLNDAIDQETVEVFRSREMLARKEREARTADETNLIAEEKLRLRRHQDELRRLLKAAALSGSVYFRGNDRSPGDRAAEVGRSAAEILGQVLPDVFERFKEAAARVADVKRGADALLAADNLQGLPPVFTSLGLLREEKGKPVFRVESGPLAEVLVRIEQRASYGDTASGRFLADELARQPFGWDFEVVRLLVLALLRAGKIEVTSKGQTIDSATGLAARDTFTNNNVFRQASFRPKKGIEFTELVRAAEAFRDTFGGEVRELNAGSIVAELRKEIDRCAETVSSALSLLSAHRLPGSGLLDNALNQMKIILRGSEDNAIATFNASHRSIKDAIKRASDLEQSLSGPRERDLERARLALEMAWPFLRNEPDLSESIRSSAAHRARSRDTRMASVTTYSSISSRRISSSVWSTLMTSSMRRWMLPAKRVWMSGSAMAESPLKAPSENLRTVIVLRLEHTHEAEPGGSVASPGIEKDGRHVHAPLELLEQREGPVHGKEGAGPQDENQIAQRIGFLGQPRRHQVHERLVLRQHRVDGVDDRLGALVPLGGEPFFERTLGPHRLVQALRQRDVQDVLAFLRQAGFEKSDLFAQRELLFGRILEERVRHVVIDAEPLARIPEREDRLEVVLEALLEIAHATNLSA